jgi:hypothetical protein
MKKVTFAQKTKTFISKILGKDKKTSDFLYYKAVWTTPILPHEKDKLAAYCIWEESTGNKSYVLFNGKKAEKKSVARFELDESSLIECEKFRLSLARQ